MQWSDGRRSWVKKSNLPIKIKEKMEKDHELFQQGVMEIIEFGQKRKQLTESQTSTMIASSKPFSK